MFNKLLNLYLENFKTLFDKIFKDKKLMLLVGLLSIIFIIILFFIYNNFIKDFINKNHVLNKEYINNDKNNKDVLIIFFYTEWCPYCKQALPEIDKFEEYINGLNEENDYIITLSKIDCDKNTTMADKYKVEGYPTIKLIYKGNVYNYDAKPKSENLKQFLDSSIN